MYSSPRPLPKMPRSSLSLQGTTKHDACTNERTLPPVSAADLAGSLPAPQHPAKIKEIRRGDPSKLQCHPENSDLFSPKRDADELSDSARSYEKHYSPLIPIRPEYLSGLTDAVSPILEKTTEDVSEKLVRQYTHRWLREEKGRRWVEEDYHLVVQFLRELR
jgi:hypothetical protein